MGNNRCHISNETIKKLRKQQIPLHLHFTDYTAVFDTVWRHGLWCMMTKCAIYSRIISILEHLYRNTESAVTLSGVMTDTFKIKTGVRQGCVMSPMYFNIFLDSFTKEIHSFSPELKQYDDLTTERRSAYDKTPLSASFNRHL